MAAQPKGPMITEINVVIPLYIANGKVMPNIPTVKLRAMVEDVYNEKAAMLANDIALTAILLGPMLGANESQWSITSDNSIVSLKAAWRCRGGIFANA